MRGLKSVSLKRFAVRASSRHQVKDSAQPAGRGCPGVHLEAPQTLPIEAVRGSKQDEGYVGVTLGVLKELLLQWPIFRLNNTDEVGDLPVEEPAHQAYSDSQ